eukprot:Em0002g996a
MPKEKKVKGREKLIHPNSRKALQLFKKAHRDEKLDKKKAERSISNANEVMKLMWFKEHLDASKKFYTHSEMVEFVERFDFGVGLSAIGFFYLSIRISAEF